MRADFNAVDRLSQKVLEKVRAAKYVRATSGAGTNIFAELEPNYKWFKTSGIISPEKWGNLPGGECFTAPGEVNGVFVVDGVVGDFLCSRFGILRETPLTIHVGHNRITSVECANKELERAFWEYTHTDENSDRVGEFAIGTNIGVSRVIGNILQDEKFPGIHIAFGDPYGAHTGAPWKSTRHIDVVGLEFNIWLGDGTGEEQIMKRRQVSDRGIKALKRGKERIDAGAVSHCIQRAVHDGQVCRAAAAAERAHADRGRVSRLRDAVLLCAGADAAAGAHR